MAYLEAGDKAPEFSAKNQHGKEIKLSDYKGKKVILYFYPKDDTPGCTAEACNLRDNHTDLIRKGYVVLGVSPDNEKSHTRFTDKYKLPFDLLADPEKTMLKAYGAWGLKKNYGKEYEGVLRTTYVISEAGKIEKAITKVDTKEAARQILEG
jgi:thioredoxin-dependent peroxiredoxin